MEGDEPKSPSRPEDSPVMQAVEVDLTRRAADFERSILEVIKEIDREKDFYAMTDKIYEEKKRYMTSALEELSTEHKSLADQYEDIINKRRIKNRLLDLNSPVLTLCLTRMQENGEEFEHCVNTIRGAIGKERYCETNNKIFNKKKVIIKAYLRRLLRTYKRLVYILEDNLVDRRHSSIKIRSLEEEVERMKPKFNEEKVRIQTRFESAKKEITVRYSHVEGVQRQLTEISKEVSEITSKVFKNSIEIRACNGNQDKLKELFNRLSEELEAQSSAVNGFKQQIMEIGGSQFVNSLIEKQIQWDTDSGSLVETLRFIGEVIYDTLLEIGKLKNRDDAPRFELDICEELDALRVSLSQELWSFSDLQIILLEEDLEQKISRLEKKIGDQQVSQEYHTSED